MVDLADVRAAAERLRPYIVRTPLERSASLSDHLGVEAWLKLECFQATGSFKLRGALNALLCLDRPSRVVTASAGNHGLGVARAASLVGTSATVVVPETASQIKVDALRRSGAALIQHGATYDDAEAEALRLSGEAATPFVSAYNDPAVVAGAGTIALEVLEDMPTLAAMVVPAGGGGLIGGVGLAAHAVKPEAQIYGVQSVASPALQVALEAGAIVPVEVKPSLADGLSGNVEHGSITLPLLLEHVRKVVLVEESEIASAMRWLLVNERVVVEGSGAVGVAALLHRRLSVQGPVAVVLSGRNVSKSVLEFVLPGLAER